LSDEEIQKDYPNVPVEKVPFLLRLYPGERTQESQEHEKAFYEALAKEFGIVTPRSDPLFWVQLAHGLMYRHVPALRAKPRGRSEKSAIEHGFWIKLYRQSKREMSRVRTSDTLVYRDIVKRLKKLSRKPEYADLKLPDNVTWQKVKSHVVRALRWEAETDSKQKQWRAMADANRAARASNASSQQQVAKRVAPRGLLSMSPATVTKEN